MSLEMRLALFDAPRVRRRNPETSRAAAAKVPEFAASHFAIIILALKDHGPMTIDEIAVKCRLDKWAVARRLPELQRIEAAVPTDESRPGMSGRQQRSVEGAVRRMNPQIVALCLYMIGSLCFLGGRAISLWAMFR